MSRYGRPRVTRRRDDKLARIDPGAFEELVASHYRSLGYSVERVGHGGSHFDGGIDLKLRRGSEYIVVQCKRENAYQVPHNVGHQLIGVMCTQGATGAVVVNTGEYTRHARESAAAEARLTLVDGNEVRRWFPELAQPSPEPKWERVADGYGHARHRRPRAAGKEGAEMLIACAVLIALMVWQCSRPGPVDRVAESRLPGTGVQSRSTGQVTERGPPLESSENHAPGMAVAGASAPEPTFQQLSPQELEDWKRGNEESMKILERTTSELPLAPRDP